MNKFRARKTVVGSVTFDSGLEARRYQNLLLLQKAGEINNLEIKPIFRFSIDGRPILIKSAGYPNGRQVKYIADFAYFDVARNKRIVEDVKGFRTDVFKLKKAITECLFPGVIVEEVRHA